jgi:hypothetical protein
MSGGLIALILASVTGMLAAWLWIGQTNQVNTVSDVARAEQRCEQARFDQRFDSTLASSNPSNPLAQADAERVQRDCAEAERLRAEQQAAAARQAAQMRDLQQSLSNSLSPQAPQPNQPKEQEQQQ